MIEKIEHKVIQYRINPQDIEEEVSKAVKLALSKGGIAKIIVTNSQIEIQTNWKPVEEDSDY